MVDSWKIPFSSGVNKHRCCFCCQQLDTLGTHISLLLGYCLLSFGCGSFLRSSSGFLCSGLCFWGSSFFGLGSSSLLGGRGLLSHRCGLLRLRGNNFLHFGCGSCLLSLGGSGGLLSHGSLLGFWFRSDLLRGGSSSLGSSRSLYLYDDRLGLLLNSRSNFE